MSDISVNKRYKNAVDLLNALEASDDRKDTEGFQQRLNELIKEFVLIKRIVDLLALFSNNETIDEVAHNYIPFLNVDYYLANLYGWIQPPQPQSLQQCKAHYVEYIQLVERYGLLSSSQKQLIDPIVEKKPLSTMDFDDWDAANRTAWSPMEKRQLKIDTHKQIKALKEKLSILSTSTSTSGIDDEADNLIDTFDEDTVRKVYLDQVKLHILLSFNQLESVLMELELAKKAPPLNPNKHYEDHQKAAQRNDKSVPTKDGSSGYTTKVESLPWKQVSASQLVSKQGKILQPFTIVSNRNQLREKVFGTGQTLPSMTVEEYLDYELANGKLMKDEVKDKPKNEDDDAEDEEEELRNRLWDDWKDDNPKGSGNMKANIG
ncbi:uncharacterized protein KQ657_003803 [Scheffersomyces spartinae]|uniref:TAP42-like protein n=1 Tax=Scheffersomyces spartinae TaxID=45513 RepID=A0A9P7VCD6_9ASCO|nr:uncharacterized protein KQ657_003803 [Scheffersomyces spartinae]KAG7195277.1 hypothetical protein KQ657_003803 [Scheffersomyces spartinae]